MIHLALFIILVLTSGCASQTARISQAATATSASVAVARGHLLAANAELLAIEQQVVLVHDAIPYVSDDTHPIYSTLTWVSAGVIAVVLGVIVYTYIPRK
jgi:hypothetical protein